MAKQRRTNTAASALGGLLSVIEKVAGVELADNPDALAEVKTMVADTKDSNFVTAAEHLDDNIETIHQVDEILDAAGIDRVELQRQGALDGAIATVNAEQELTAEDAALTIQEQAFDAEEQAEQAGETTEQAE